MQRMQEFAENTYIYGASTLLGAEVLNKMTLDDNYLHAAVLGGALMTLLCQVHQHLTQKSENQVVESQEPIKSSLELLIEEGHGALETRDISRAMEIYRQVLSEDNLHTDAYLGLIHCHKAEGDLENAAMLAEFCLKNCEVPLGEYDRLEAFLEDYENSNLELD